jgi:hypothetical protein
MPKYRLTLDVEYADGLTAQGDTPADVLERAAGFLVGEGLLCGDTDLEVETWDCKVERIDEEN